MKKFLLDRMWIIRPIFTIAVVAALARWGVHLFARGNRWDGVETILSAAAIAAAFWYFDVRPTIIPRRAVVMIRLAGPISEGPAQSPLDRLRGRGAVNLFDLRFALEAASHDRAVNALIVEIGGIDAGLATCMEIHRGLRAVVASGKRAIAMLAAEQIGLRDFIVA